MSIDLCIYDKCNNRCLMCTNPDGPWPTWDNDFDYSYKAIINRIEARQKEIKKAESIYITGGEPTLHPEFLEILKYLKDNFSDQRVKLLTNGRRFSYKNFTEKTLSINQNFEIDLSIYGPNSKIHDSITRSKNSFKQTCAGLDNLLKQKKSGQIIGVRFVLTKLSYKYLKEMINLVRTKFNNLDRVIIIFPEIEAQAVKNLKKIKITYQEVRPYVEDIFSQIRYVKGIRFYHFPLCTLSYNFWPHIWRTVSENELTFLKKCNKCIYKEYCHGIQKEYLKYFGEKDFSPVISKIKIIKSGNFHHPIKRINK